MILSSVNYKRAWILPLYHFLISLSIDTTNKQKLKMQFSNALSLLTLTAIATAASTFDLISINSGSSYQYYAVGLEEGSLSLKNGHGDHFILNDDTSLQETSSKKYIHLTQYNNFAVTDKPVKGFKIADDYLSFEDKTFKASQVGSFIQLTSSDGTPVALKVIDQKKA